MNNKTVQSDDELYFAFADEEMKAYAEEAKQRWGNTDAYKQSQERSKHWTKADVKKIKEAGIALTRKIAAVMKKGPEDTDVQKLIFEHYQSINTFYDCSFEMYQNLGKMYIDDLRFTAYYEKFSSGLAQFMYEAINCFCKSQDELQIKKIN